jgi:hypothetical protein
MRPLRRCTVLIGTAVTLTLGTGWSTAEAASGHPVAPGTGRAAAAAAAGAHRGALGGTWGAAQEVPGTATLNQGGNAQTDSVSCASAGNCSAGGYYVDGSGQYQAFVVSETHGSWRKAEEVPGTATLNQGGDATLESVSCASAGNCSAGGYYTDGSGNGQVFVVSEIHGTWGTAEEIPGTAGLDQGGFLDAQVESVSCASAGNCSAVGTYAGNGNGDAMAFVVNETHCTWGTAQEVPGTATLNEGGAAVTNVVSCASAGKCAADGYYTDGSGHSQAFVVSEP